MKVFSQADYPLFSSIGIETGSKCNRKCVFCPVAYEERPEEWMSEEMFLGILWDLVDENWKGRLEFYIYNEPTRDKRLKKFLKMAREELPNVCMMINTNGDFFRSASDIEDLFNAGLNQMQINIYSHQKRFDKVSEWIQELGYDDQSSVYQYAKPDSRILKMDARFDSDAKTLGSSSWSNRSGLIGDFRPPLKSPMERVCTKPFRFLNINWKGEALICCNDYRGDIVVGNVSHFTVAELWRHPVMMKYRAHLQDGDRSLPLCDVCDFNGGPYMHNIRRVDSRWAE